LLIQENLIVQIPTFGKSHAYSLEESNLPRNFKVIHYQIYSNPVKLYDNAI